MRAKTAYALCDNSQQTLIQVVYLHHAAFADKLGMPVPGVISAAKCEKVAPRWNNLSSIVLNVVF